MRKIVHPFADAFEKVLARTSEEGRTSTEHRVRHDAQAPNVAAVVVRLALNDLRSNVERRSHHLRESFGRVIRLGKTKVNKFDVLALSALEDQVLWLDVAIEIV